MAVTAGFDFVDFLGLAGAALALAVERVARFLEAGGASSVSETSTGAFRFFGGIVVSMDITVPSDWPKHLPELRSLDSALRCPICADLFTVPLILSCGHSFCSLCIRSALVVSDKCPSCSTRTDEARARRNLSLEAAVESFKGPARDRLLELSNKLAVKSPARKKRKLTSLKAVAVSSDSDLELLEHQSTGAKPLPAKSQWQQLMTASSSKSLGPGDVRIPKTNYAILSLQAIRKLLSDIDLPSKGDKQSLITRHTQFSVLHNANLDLKPDKRKTFIQLKQDLENWERRDAVEKMEIDDDHALKYKGEFQKLIQEIRDRPVPEPIPSDEEDEVQSKVRHSLSPVSPRAATEESNLEADDIVADLPTIHRSPSPFDPRGPTLSQMDRNAPGGAPSRLFDTIREPLSDHEGEEEAVRKPEREVGIGWF